MSALFKQTAASKITTKTTPGVVAQKEIARDDAKRRFKKIQNDTEEKTRAVIKTLSNPQKVVINGTTYKTVEGEQKGAVEGKLPRVKLPNKSLHKDGLEENQVTLNFAAELPPGDKGVTLTDSEVNERWKMHYFRNYAEQPQPKDGYKFFYGARRTQDRTWLVKDRVLWKHYSGDSNMMLMAVNNKWIVGLDTGKIRVAPIVDARQPPIFTTFPWEVPSQECNLTIHNDDVIVSDRFGGLHIYALPAGSSSSKVTITMTDLQRVQKSKAIKLASCLAANELYVVALYSAKKLLLYNRVTKKSTVLLREPSPLLLSNSCCIFGHRIHIGTKDGTVFTCNVKPSSDPKKPNPYEFFQLGDAIEKTLAQQNQETTDKEEGDTSMDAAEEKKEKDSKTESKGMPILQVYSQGCRAFVATEDRIRVHDSTRDPPRVFDIPVIGVQGMSASGSILAIHIHNNLVIFYDLVTCQSAFQPFCLEVAVQACYDNICFSSNPTRLSYFKPGGDFFMAELMNVDEVKAVKMMKADEEKRDKELIENLEKARLEDVDDVKSETVTSSSDSLAMPETTPTPLALATPTGMDVS